jgi:hypothetical protein
MHHSEFNLQAQLACARRELQMRRVYYPKRIASRTMTVDDADRQTACMEAIVFTLEKLMLEEANRKEPTLL